MVTLLDTEFVISDSFRMRWAVLIKPEERRRIYWTIVSVDTLASVEGELLTICSRTVEMAQLVPCGGVGPPTPLLFQQSRTGHSWLAADSNYAALL
jgi:hypothetical protein